MLKTCVAFVTYNTYGNYDWTKICILSYRHIFKNMPIFVVDHNNNPEEQEFLIKNNATIIKNTGPHTHGIGLDVATNYAKQQGYDAIVFVEPDCIFQSDRWYHNILQSLESGNSMTSTFRYNYGPLHPCGSGWIIKDIPYSFEIANKTVQEISHPRYLELMKLDTLCFNLFNAKYKNNLCHFFLYRWDIGIKNWFWLEVQNKANLIDNSGFYHFWGSHIRDPQELLNKVSWVQNIVRPWFDKINPKKLFY